MPLPVRSACRSSTTIRPSSSAAIPLTPSVHLLLAPLLDSVSVTYQYCSRGSKSSPKLCSRSLLAMLRPALGRWPSLRSVFSVVVQNLRVTALYVSASNPRLSYVLVLANTSGVCSRRPVGCPSRVYSIICPSFSPLTNTVFVCAT